jgi:F0F1-type ATP synthase membrane subunit b/b'
MEDLLGGSLNEIFAHPIRFTADVVQSLLLLAVIAWAGRRYAVRRLADRRSRIATELADADAAQRDSVRIREESRAVVAQAREAAPGILQDAQARADREREASTAAIESEAREIVEQARRSIELELAGVRREASERLVRLTTETARRYVEELLTEAERRALTQKAILAFLDQVDASTVPADAGAA